MHDLKAKLSAHVEHAAILGQDLPGDGMIGFGPCEGDQPCHQRVTDPPALPVGADDDRILGLIMVGVTMQTCHAQNVMRCRINGDEGHFPGVVELGQAGDQYHVDRAHGCEEAHLKIIRRTVSEHV